MELNREFFGYRLRRRCVKRYAQGVLGAKASKNLLPFLLPLLLPLLPLLLPLLPLLLPFFTPMQVLTNVIGGGKNQKFKKYKRDAEKCCIYENKAVPLYFEN